MVEKAGEDTVADVAVVADKLDTSAAEVAEIVVMDVDQMEPVSELVAALWVRELDTGMVEFVPTAASHREHRFPLDYLYFDWTFLDCVIGLGRIELQDSETEIGMVETASGAAVVV